MTNKMPKRHVFTGKMTKNGPKRQFLGGGMTQKMAQTSIASVGYTPNSRPPDPPPLSVTPLILALRAPIRHIFV